MIARSLSAAAVTAVALFPLTPSVEAAAVYGFTGLTNNKAADVAIGETQLSLEVSQFGANQVAFKFINEGPNAAVIARAYWEQDSSLLNSIGPITSSSNVHFQIGGAPPHLPGSNPKIDDFKVSAKAPPPKWGVGPGEWVQVVFNLVHGKTYENIVFAIDNDKLQIGVHVIAYAGGGSESFVVDGQVIPTPAAASMGAALIGLGLFRRNRQRRR